MDEWQQLLNQTPVVLMVGGSGNRLRPLTDHCPKPLLKIGGKPLLQRTLESLIRQGFRNFYFSVNYKAELIEGFFGDGAKWGVDITYLREQERMGTAGSLRLIQEQLCTSVVVLNGDLFSESDLPIANLLRFHTTQTAVATMAVAPHEIEIPFGVVETNGPLLTNIREKPTLTSFINAGMYVVEPETIALLPSKGMFDMPELFEQLMIVQSKTCAYPLLEEWIDIGSFETFDSVCRRFANKENLSQSASDDFSVPIENDANSTEEDYLAGGNPRATVSSRPSAY